MPINPDAFYQWLNHEVAPQARVIITDHFNLVVDHVPQVIFDENAPYDPDGFLLYANSTEALINPQYVREDADQILNLVGAERLGQDARLQNQTPGSLEDIQQLYSGLRVSLRAHVVASRLEVTTDELRHLNRKLMDKLGLSLVQNYF